MYEFPPPPVTPIWIPVGYVGLMLLAWGRAGYWLLHPRRKAQIYDLSVWFLLAVGITIFVTLSVPKFAEFLNPFVWPYLMVLWSGTAINAVLGLIKLFFDGDGWQVCQSFLLLPLTILLVNFVCEPFFRGDPRGPRRSACKNNLKQIGLALHNYHDVYETLPPRIDGEPPRSWRVDLLPWMERKDLQESWNSAVPWDAGTNRSLSEQVLPFWICPSAKGRNERVNGMGRSDYSIPESEQGIYSPGQPARSLRDVTGGLSSTILVVEACGQDLAWGEPRDVDTAKNRVDFNGPGQKRGESDSLLSSYHSSGAHMLLGDGSIRFLSQETSPEVLKRLLDATDRVDDVEW